MPLAPDEMSTLNDAWKLPPEWMVTTAAKMPLLVSYCRVRQIESQPHLRMYESTIILLERADIKRILAAKSTRSRCIYYCN